MYDIIIIGMGISGITAGIYAKRANKKVLLFESQMVGGLINNLDKIENYPGYINIKGSDLAYNLLNQINKLQVPYKNEKIIKVDLKDEIKKVYTRNSTYECKNIILAMGRKPKLLGLKDEEKLFGHGLSTCATCDGNFYKNKVVAVYGQGLQAIEAANYLADIASKIYLITPNEISNLVNVKVEKISNEQITGIETNNDGNIYKIIISNSKSLKVDGLFIYNGYLINNELLKEYDILNANGYVLVDEHYKTTINNVYAIGDLIKKDLYQIVTGASDGAKVITEILKNK